MTKISIITITFNSEITVEDTIKSIIKQGYKDLEYIIIDGGSTDRTLEIINNYLEYIDVFISEPDEGISDAFNKGIKRAKGEVIGIINSDDYLNKNALMCVSKAVEEYTDVDVFYGNSIMFDDNHNYTYHPINKIENIKRFMFISHPAVFVKKSAYEKWGEYNLSYMCAMDFDLLSRFYCKGAIFKYIDSDLTWFRLGGVSKKRQVITIKESIEIALQNGENKLVVHLHYILVNIKSIILEILGFFDFEVNLRRVIKKQSASGNAFWFRENE